MASGGDEQLLPWDLIVKIFERLPVKSIVRFRCVCKLWKEIFKIVSFFDGTFSHPDCKNPSLLVRECDRENGRESWRSSLRLLNHKMETVEILSIPSIMDSFRGGWRIIGSCNGLLCVEGGGSKFRGRPPHSLWLWNPLIGEIRQVTQTTYDYWGFCTFGFGFSSEVKDHKVVKFYNQELRKEKETDQDPRAARQGHDGVEVYSLRTGSWKELEFRALQNITVQSTTVSTDGTMIWLGKEGSSPVLVSFDIATEMFAVTPIPFVDRISSATLHLYQDKFVICWRHFGSHSWDIRVMEEVAGESGKSFSCTEEYSVDPCSGASNPVCIWRNGIVFRGESDVKGEGKHFLSLFNLTTSEWKEFNSSAHVCVAALNHESSLLSVGNTEAESLFGMRDLEDVENTQYERIC